MAEIVLASVIEVQQWVGTRLLVFEACDPHIQVLVGSGLADGQARRPERVVSVKAQQRCTYHLSPPNLEVWPVLQRVAEPHQQVLQKDLHVHDEGSQSVPALSRACKFTEA